MHNIEYILKYTLDSTLLRIENLKDISNPNNISDFKRLYGDSKTLKLFTNDGINFPLFNVPLQKGTLHTVKYCEVAVGESLFVTKEYAKTLNPPDHFSSFIINQKNDSFDSLIENEILEIRDFCYVIKEEDRILPLYEVTFEYDEELEKKSKGVFLCERCKQNQSISFCPSERANFCEKCDEEVHIDEFHKRHDRYYFNQVGKKRFIYCSIHPETMVDYFCMACVIPICTKCKINGNHSEAPNNSHGLIKYLDACDRLLENVKESNDDLNPIIENIKDTLEVFKSKYYNFKEEINEVRHKIDLEYRRIMNELKIYENKQYQVAYAHYIKGLCKVDYLSRMVEYSTSLEPSQLVRNYKNVVKQRDNINLEEKITFTPKAVELKGRLTLGDPIKLVPRKGYLPRNEKSTKLYVETRGDSNDY